MRAMKAYLIQGQIDDDEQVVDVCLGVSLKEAVASQLAQKADNLIAAWQSYQEKSATFEKKYRPRRPVSQPRVGKLSAEERKQVGEETKKYAEWERGYKKARAEFDEEHKPKMDVVEARWWNDLELRRYAGGIWEGGFSAVEIELYESIETAV
jgi:hypothetical protein